MSTDGETAPPGTAPPGTGEPEQGGPVPTLDPVIHAQARLRVIATLATLAPGDRLTFPRLQQLLDMTAGNLSTHLRKLEEADYVDLTKAHEQRTPVTYAALTSRGRGAFEEYRDNLRRMLA